MAATTRGINKSLLPSAKTRSTIAKRLAGATGAMTTATVAEMEQRHAWFGGLSAEHRSWITLVAQAGIDGFVRWFADPEPSSTVTSPGCKARSIGFKVRSVTGMTVRKYWDRWIA